MNGGIAALLGLALGGSAAGLLSGAPATGAVATEVATLAGPGREPLSGSRVLLDTSACLSVSAGELRRLVGLELGDLLAPPPPTGAPAPSPTRNRLALAIACIGERATLQARAAGKADALERTINLTDFPEGAAPRGLALAGIELLAALDAGVRERIGESGAPAAGSAASAPTISMGILGLRRQFMGPAGLGAWGGRLELVRDRARGRLAVDLDAAATGSSATSLGTAHAFLGSAGAFAGARFTPSAIFTWSLAMGARLGLARLDGVPDTANGAVGNAYWRPWGGPALSARGALGRPRLSAIISLELGYTALGAEALAATTTVLALRGPWLTAAAGAAF